MIFSRNSGFYQRFTATYHQEMVRGHREKRCPKGYIIRTNFFDPSFAPAKGGSAGGGKTLRGKPSSQSTKVLVLFDLYQAKLGLIQLSWIIQQKLRVQLLSTKITANSLPV